MIFGRAPKPPGHRFGGKADPAAVRGDNHCERLQEEANMFEPENGLEALMQAAGKDPSIAPRFYEALLTSELYVLTPEAPMKPGRRRSLKFQEKIGVATVEFQDMTWLPAFTSKKRISDYVKEPETCLGAAGRNLFEMLPDANFWLNPLSECQKPLPASEIALLMSGKIFDTLKNAGCRN
jgi:hypothetical protein